MKMNSKLLYFFLFFFIIGNYAKGQSIVNLGEDKQLCFGDSITLDAGANFASYLWNTGETTKTIQVTNSGIYSVTVSFEEIEIYDEVKISFQPLKKDFMIPNIFTPNGDAINDIFYAATENKFVLDYKLSIFNRLGQKLFFAENPYIGWDGRTSSGEKVSEGTYYYVITYAPVCDQGSIKGTINLK